MPSDRDAGLCSSNHRPMQMELPISRPRFKPQHPAVMEPALRSPSDWSWRPLDQRWPSNSNLDQLPYRILTVQSVHILEASSF